MAAAARVQPRKPTWLSPEGAAAPQLVPTDNTVRVLEFASALRPQPRDSSASAYQHGLQPSQDGLPARGLSPEPAYASVLGRLTELSQGAHSPRAGRDAETLQPPVSNTVRDQAAAAPVVSSSHAYRPQEQGQQPHLQRDKLEAGQAAMGQPPTLPPSPAAALQRKPLPDLGLQLQLKQRIEQAKAEIKEQLSPLFRVSQALLSGEDPAAAADTLDEVAAAEYAGQRSSLPLLPGPTQGSLPGSPAVSRRLAAAVADAAGRSLMDGRPAGDSWQISSRLASLSVAGDSQSAVRDNPLYEGQSIEAAPGSPLAPDDVDSLVLSARAAVSKAHATIADLASPPHPSRSPAPQASAAREVPGNAEPAPAGHGSARPFGEGPLRAPYRPPSIPAGTNSNISKTKQVADHASEEGSQPTRQQQAWPCAEQQQLQEPEAPAEGNPVVAHSQALAPASLLAPPVTAAPDLEGRIVQLRQRSEDVIRTECDKLIAAMHAMFDEFLHSVHHHGLLVRVSVGPGGLAGAAASNMDHSSPAAWSGAAEPRGAWPVPTAAMQSQQTEEHKQQQQQPGAHRLEATAPPHQAELTQQPSADATQDPLTAGEGSGCSSDLGSEQPVQHDSSENVAPNALGAQAAAAAPPGFEFPRQQGGSPLESREAGSSLWPPPQGQHQPWEYSRGALADDGLGFGSPIRPAPGSQRPSPAKPRSILGSLAERPLQGNLTSRHLQPQSLSATGARQPAAGPAAAAASAAQVSGRGLLHAYLSAPAASPSYLTARSSLGLASSPSPRPGDPHQATSRLQLPLGDSSTAGGVGSRSAALPVQQAGAPPRRDLDSIVNSIRRLAAETKVRQGALAPPSSRLLQPASSSRGTVATLTATKAVPVTRPIEGGTLLQSTRASTSTPLFTAKSRLGLSSAVQQGLTPVAGSSSSSSSRARCGQL